MAQLLVPEQPPDHPEKVSLVPGISVRVTDVPLAKDALHVCGQLMPTGVLVTVLVPLTVTDNFDCDCLLKFAVTVVLPVSVSLQLLVPVQAPDHPMKESPLAGVALSINAVPGLKLAVQDCPQLIPAGLLLTVPDPEPLRETAN
jgi:hypothetical protein